MLPTLLQYLSQSLPTLPLGGLDREEQTWLLARRRHPPLVSARRAEIVFSRVKLLCWLFLALMPIWLVVEYVAFPPELWRYFLLARAGMVAAFIALLWRLHRAPPDIVAASRAALALFCIPPAFYLAASALLHGQSLSGFAVAVVATHTFFPILLMAGVSLFPLALSEALLLTMPVFLARAFVMWQFAGPLDSFTKFGALWFLLLVGSLAALASLSQLAFIIVLVRQAVRDLLTGAFGRFSGEELLDLQATIAERSGAPFAVAFIDLDRFKQVNDRFGHEAGDRVLRNAAEQIQKSLRGTDALIRWGGEEFLVLMPNTECAQAMIGLERLRTAGFGLRPDGKPQTASIGIAERIADGVDSAGHLVDLADQRMYEAKKAGRNRMVGCTPIA